MASSTSKPCVMGSQGILLKVFFEGFLDSTILEILAAGALVFAIAPL